MTARGQQAAAPIVLLGPQTDFAEIGEVLDEFKVVGTVALITTGWQENESEDEALVEQLRRPAVNLALHAYCPPPATGSPAASANLPANSGFVPVRQCESLTAFQYRQFHTFAAPRQFVVQIDSDRRE